MTDVASAKAASPGFVLSMRPPIRLVWLATTTIGLGAATLGIWGFFINIKHMADTSLSASSGWWCLVPISIGVAALGLLVPRALYFTAGLPLLAMGMLLVWGPLLTGRGGHPGYGFWMIAIGSGLLTLAALASASIDLASRANPTEPSDQAEQMDPPADLRQIRHLPRRTIVVIFGVAAGIVSFVGYFVNFFNHPASALSSSNTGDWWFFVPISIGIGTLGLLIRRAPLWTSGLPLLAIGLALGFRAYFASVKLPTDFAGLGYGFWMITIGAGAAILAGWGLIAADLQDDSRGARMAHTGEYGGRPQ